MSDSEGEQELPKEWHLKASVQQVAMLNKMLPKNFKLDVLDVVRRQMEVH